MAGRNYPRASKPARAITAEKQVAVINLRKTGMSFDEIGQRLNISLPYAYKLYKEGLRRVIEEPAAELLKLELARIDDMIKLCTSVLRENYLMYRKDGPVQAPVVDGNGNPVLDAEGKLVYYYPFDPAPKLAAIDKLIRLSERRAKLLGLDKPTRSELTGPDGAPLLPAAPMQPDMGMDWLGFPIPIDQPTQPEEKDVTAESVQLTE